MSEELISKTQRKREAEALKQLGLTLVSLSDQQLEKLPLTELLHKAILDARSIKSHGARRRQAQLIGKLMRSADYEAIEAACQALEEESAGLTAAFHELEQWRERLILEDNQALTEFVDLYHPEDVQQLRQLVKKAKDEKLKGKNTGAFKALFRFLRTCQS